MGGKTLIRVAFIDVIFEDREAIRLDGCDFSLHGPLCTADEIASAAAGADVLCMRDQFGRVTGELLDRLPDLKMIVTRSAGYDHIDLTETKRRGIRVCNVPDYGAHMIAEMAFGLLLAVARNIVRGNDRYHRERRFSDEGLKGIELYGKTLGVVGVGRVGLHSVRIGKGFGMRVIAYDTVERPHVAADLGYEYTSLERVLSESDVVTLHVPHNKETHHLLDARRLATMKPGAILVNTSRGAVVDTHALIQVLRSGHLAGAGLDVLECERSVHYDFTGLNVVVTPHIGWYTDGAAERILSIALGNIAAFAAGCTANLVEP